MTNSRRALSDSNECGCAFASPVMGSRRRDSQSLNGRLTMTKTASATTKMTTTTATHALLVGLPRKQQTGGCYAQKRTQRIGGNKFEERMPLDAAAAAAAAAAATTCCRRIGQINCDEGSRTATSCIVEDDNGQFLASPLTLGHKTRASKMERRCHRKQGANMRPLLLGGCLLALIVAGACLPEAVVGTRIKRQVTDEEPPTTTTLAGETIDATTTESSPTTTTTTAATTTTTTSTTTEALSTTTQKPKTPAINFTLVNELFERALDEPEVIQKWLRMDKTISEGVKVILKAVVPQLTSMAQDARVSGNCAGAILKWVLSLRQMRSWAVQMLDAIGKPTAGLLEGSLTLFGNYRQCMKIRAPDEDEIELVEEFREYFRGQYCVLELKPALPQKPTFYSLNSTIPSLARKSYKYYEKTIYDELSELAMAFNFVSIRADLCVPSLCSRDDIQRVADFLANKVEMRARVKRCEMELKPAAGDTIPAAVRAARNNTSNVGFSSTGSNRLLWWSVFFFGLLLLLVMGASLLSALLAHNNKKQSGAAGGKSRTRLNKLLSALSLQRSLSHIVSVHMDRINDIKPAPLYGLRLIIILWVCLASLAAQMNFQFLRELLFLRTIIMHWSVQLLVNSSLQFESLILLTAFTYSYQNINANLSDLLKYTASKYSRFAPSVMLLAAITIALATAGLNSGHAHSPTWSDFVDPQAEVCASTGWLNLFFIQNFLPYDQICLPQTWLLCVELQLCLLSIPLVYMLNKSFDQHQGRFRWSAPANLLLASIALLGCLRNFANIYQNSLPAAWFLTFPDRQDKARFFGLHLQRTSSHLTTWAVGLLAGHLCRCQATLVTFTGRPYGRKLCSNLMWLTSFTLMIALIYSCHSWTLTGKSHLEAPLASACYAALAPLAWAVAWSLLLFYITVPISVNGAKQANTSATNHHQFNHQHHSLLAQLLTSDINLVRLGRMSFLAYLLNPFVNSLVYSLQEQAVFSSILMLLHTFVGNLVITFAFSFLASALVELPCRRLFKKLLLGTRRQSTNFDILARQLNLRHQHDGPSHDSFAIGAHQQPFAHAHHPSQKQAMIPMR